jgi:hypothetical protein
VGSPLKFANQLNGSTRIWGDHVFGGAANSGRIRSFSKAEKLMGQSQQDGMQALFQPGTLPIRVGFRRCWPEKKNRRTDLCDGIFTGS